MDKKGFTLIEMMIVVAIIAILVAIALPNMLGSRKAANEKAVLAELRTIGTALETYYIRENKYPSGLNVLVDADLLPSSYDSVGTGAWNLPGRRYKLDITINTSDDTYNITATPQNDKFGTVCYSVTTGGVLKKSSFSGGSCSTNWETI